MTKRLNQSACSHFDVDAVKWQSLPYSIVHSFDLKL